MRNKTAAFQNASDALSQLGIPENLPALREAGVFMRRSTLGGSHSVVTYPPLEALRPVTAGQLDSTIRYGDCVSVYIHIPFCEMRCSFCHYDIEYYRDQEAPYIRALEKELVVWGERLSQTGTGVSSIYIGGGTPLRLPSRSLVGLVGLVRSVFNVLPSADICVEGSPRTINARTGMPKLWALKEAGVTRFSFGVQSFDLEVLKRAGRLSKRGGNPDPVRACRRVSEVFDNWNIDLIQSLNEGTPDTVWDDLQMVGELLPTHLTYYHGRFESDRPQAKWSKGFETDRDTLMGRMLMWQQLAEMGYRQTDGNRFARDTRYDDPFKKARTSVKSDMLGLGCSAYSHADGVFFRNIVGRVPYTAQMESGALPVGSAMAIDSAEYLAASYVVGLRTERIETEGDRAARDRHPALSRHYDALVEKLLALRVLERTPDDGLRLTVLGRLFEDEVLCLFYSPRVQKLLGW